MDALFLPLADTLGASVGQIKACGFTLKIAIVSRINVSGYISAHLLSASCISFGQRIYSRAFVKTCFKTCL